MFVLPWNLRFFSVNLFAFSFPRIFWFALVNFVCVRHVRLTLWYFYGRLLLVRVTVLLAISFAFFGFGLHYITTCITFYGYWIRFQYILQVHYEYITNTFLTNTITIRTTQSVIRSLTRTHRNRIASLAFVIADTLCNFFSFWLKIVSKYITIRIVDE